MALLDLQGMETPASELAHHGHSSSSTHSCGGGVSGLSLLLC
jgi:hypothetical protein